MMDKKYDPEKMIAKSRFRDYYAAWEPDDKLRLLGRMSQLPEENREYADRKNYSRRCIYHDIFSRYGMPEFTAVFCQVDDMMYSELPRAEFIYTQQIGRGGDMCDYSFKKR